MSEENKSKFHKVKIQPSLPYREREAECKKNTTNPHLAKLDRTEKEGVEVALQTEWDQKVQNMTIRSKVNHSFINYTSYTHFDKESFITSLQKALTHTLTNISP